MKNKELDLENKAIITMAQFKEYEELKQNIGKIKIEVLKRFPDSYSYYTEDSFYITSSDDENYKKIIDEIIVKTNELKSLQRVNDELKSLQRENDKLRCDLDKLKSTYNASESLLKNIYDQLNKIQSKWWYKFFNR